MHTLCHSSSLTSYFLVQRIFIPFAQSNYTKLSFCVDFGGPCAHKRYEHHLRISCDRQLIFNTVFSVLNRVFCRMHCDEE